MNKSELKNLMKEVDICMMTTLKNENELHSRPMSNNSEVEDNGNTYFFTTADTETVKDLNSCKSVSLTYQKGKDIFIQLFGKGEVSDNKDEMKDKWSADLEKWFDDGLETEGLRLIKVKADFAEYWKGKENEKIEF